MRTAAEMKRKVGLVAAIALCGVIACIAIIATHTGSSPTELGAKSQHAHKVHKGLGLKHQDMSLLQKAMADQNKERHAACLREATSAKARSACHAVAAETTRTMHAAAKKGSLAGLKGADLKLLKDAQAGATKDSVADCLKCVSKECKANCAASLASAKKSSGKAAAAKHIKLGLKKSDMALLAGAEKSQAKEDSKGMYMHDQDLKAMRHADSSEGGASGASDVNHIPTSNDGDGDWAPGMRANAMAQLKAEQQEAVATAKEASDTDADDSWSH